FINTVIYDCRDVVGDRATGVLTFPVVFGMRKTGRILQVLNLCLHGSLVVLVNLSVVKFPLVVLVFSGVIGFFYIWLFTRGEGSVSRSLEGNEWIRDVLVDGEWILIVGFREVIQFSCSPS
ncbi:hypothetical protein GWM83_03915, partial [Candidatus Bathyarchaeota archaeon]|nr:hypothetical protein [Candidatus Bathyarchaeota archaeon]NIW34687.1 hypothetical protein [Candidatus Bathyarchaeota archaeon]